MISRVGRAVWKAVVPRQLRHAAHLMMSPSAEDRVQRALRRRTPSNVIPGPVVVSGLINETKGVSQAARLTVAGLGHAGLVPVEHDLRELLSLPLGAKSELPSTGQGGVWISHANPPETTHAMGTLRPSSWLARRRIGYWVWELPQAPPHWTRAASAFDEIWTPSAFAAEAMMRAGFSVPVHVIPHPVSLLRPRAARKREAFSLSPDELIVLAMGDLNSSADRKNLLGAIEIYMRATRDLGLASRLIVKTQADEEHPQFESLARAMSQGRGDVSFVRGALSHQRVHGLIASVDLVLSPHRAEGFGLTLAEAFLLDVPVLATGWSGNLEFMSGLPDLLIRSRQVPAVDRYGVYNPEGQVWAEPDIEDAVRKLQVLMRSGEMRKALAAQGRAAVEAFEAPWSANGKVAELLRPFVEQPRSRVS